MPGGRLVKCNLDACRTSCVSQGLQSDERYAELYARGQWRRTLRAPVRLRMVSLMIKHADSQKAGDQTDMVVVLHETRRSFEGSRLFPAIWVAESRV